MSERNASQGLTEAEFDRLATFLEGIGEGAMNIEELDGFFAALICCPDLVMPSEYLPHVWGEDFSFPDLAEAQEMMGLVMKHWNHIADELGQSLERDDVYLPVLLQDHEEFALGNDWAKGFMRGMDLRPESWRELLEDEKRGGSLVPIMMLAHENDPDPSMRPRAIPRERREEIIATMIAGLTQVYRYFAPHRRALAAGARRQSSSTFRRQEPKIGRNDPCPCRSGKKYKNCCGGSNQAPH